MTTPRLSAWREAASADGSVIPWRIGEDEGAPLLLVPGLGNSSRLFGTLPRSLARLGWKPLLFDPPGLGRATDATRPWSFDAAIDDLLRVLDAAGIERATFLGTSMGGKLSIGFAARHPERIERAILYGTECLGGVRARAVYDMFDVAFRLASAGETVRALRPFLFGRSFQEEHASIVADMMRSYSPSDSEKRTSLAQVAAMKTVDFASLLEHVHAPMLLHAGLEDTLVDPADIHATAKRLPQGVARDVPRAGHSMLLENPSACLEALRDRGRDDDRSHNTSRQ
ncbi:MAG: alpha/beta fold hydrolase [Planctomycetes bacterium]|nr:alpha/beta fold hydrolase [Planctomycetota bacterium]